jgi:hypothetical protein
MSVICQSCKKRPSVIFHGKIGAYFRDRCYAAVIPRMAPRSRAASRRAIALISIWLHGLDLTLRTS